MRGLCRRPLFRLRGFVWGLWLCCGQTHVFAEHFCCWEYQELAEAFSEYRGASPTPSLGIKALYTWHSGGGGAGGATLFTWEASSQRLQPEQSVSKSGFDPGSQDCQRPMYKLEHNRKGRREGREAERGERRGRRKCVVTGEKWGSLFLSKPGSEIRSKRDVFSYIGSKLHGLVCQFCRLLAPLFRALWSSVSSSVRWEECYLPYGVVLKNKWENI